MSRRTQFTTHICLSLLFLLQLSLAENEQSLAVESTVLYYMPTTLSDFHVSAGYETRFEGTAPLFSSQWWPSPNLFLSGAFRPFIGDQDMSLYTSVGVGFTPPIAVLAEYSPSIGFGMHRLRFRNDDNHRWFHFNFTAVVPGVKYDVIVRWDHLFDAKWEENIFKVALYRRLGNRFSLQIGTDIPTSEADRLHPYAILSFAL